jgi:ABC-2 type transport system ATP-binding protein
MNTRETNLKNMIETENQNSAFRTPAIRVKDLWKRYGVVEAVRGVSMEAHKGEIFGLIGPDGAGKTTTFQILAGVMDA